MWQKLLTLAGRLLGAWLDTRPKTDRSAEEHAREIQDERNEVDRTVRRGIIDRLRRRRDV